MPLVRWGRHDRSVQVQGDHEVRAQGLLAHVADAGVVARCRALLHLRRRVPDRVGGLVREIRAQVSDGRRGPCRAGAAGRCGAALPPPPGGRGVGARPGANGLRGRLRGLLAPVGDGLWARSGRAALGAERHGLPDLPCPLGPLVSGVAQQQLGDALVRVRAFCRELPAPSLPVAARRRPRGTPDPEGPGRNVRSRGGRLEWPRAGRPPVEPACGLPTVLEYSGEMPVERRGSRKVRSQVPQRGQVRQALRQVPWPRVRLPQGARRAAGLPKRPAAVAPADLALGEP
mmetsp:Transcript_85476/g.261408  ORF Transcript_85476/g.261408 Transcript_85476/m.261408 type:complete len:287 (-) Transcript_85476:237-1097(-)